MRRAFGRLLTRLGRAVSGERGNTGKARNSGYSHHGANTTKKSLIGWLSSSLSAHDDIDRNILKLRERSRDLYMGGALIATGALKTMRTNVIGPGLTVKPSIKTDVLGITPEDADKWQRIALNEFQLWADTVDCDAARQNDFADLQQLAFLAWLMDGDVFVALPLIPRHGDPYDLRVMLIEADRVCDPPNADPSKPIFQGVETGENGEVVAYHVCDQHPASGYSGLAAHKEWKRVKAFGDKTGRRNMLHVMESERIGQSRGVPVLAPIIEAAKQLGRYTEAELVAAVVAGMFTVFLSTEDPNTPPGESSIPFDDLVDADDDTTVELGNGSVVTLGPNEKAQIADPGRPYAGFEAFVNAICRQVGAALELPYEILVKQFNSSYSASRASLLEAWKMFKTRRSWFVKDFCQPVYEEVITEAVAKGRLSAPGFWASPEMRKAWLCAEWYGPTQGQIDPLKEVNASKIRVEQGFSTRARETSELTGGDFESNVRQLEHEESLLKSAGLSSKGGYSDSGNNEESEGKAGGNAVLDDEDDGGEE
ncbi:MAG: phage portal protein [Synergistaceae bacterium]|jgi:lambda family phage portal protein|nr:phage portal protein [Synergistaceae bacterium]